jgi:hypothetical protein
MIWGGIGAFAHQRGRAWWKRNGRWWPSSVNERESNVCVCVCVCVREREREREK